MRIWVDMTAPAHPLVLRPVIERLSAAGHEVRITARDYAQTLAIIERLGIPHVAIGAHGGASRRGKLRALGHRTRRMIAFGRRGFDLALAHGSNDLALAAAALRIPAVNTFDYEWATQQHNVGCRLARRVVVPEAIPPERLRRYGVRGGKLARYPGLKEEYYLYDFRADPSVPHALRRRRGAHRGRRPATARRLALPPQGQPTVRRGTALLGNRHDVHAVVIPRTEQQRAYARALRFDSLIVPDRAVDAQSLIAQADLVVSAGGTMNRESVALGTPDYTTYGGRLGGVDEWLIREGRLRPLIDPRAMELRKHAPEQRHVMRRDPQLLVDLVLQAVE